MEPIQYQAECDSDKKEGVDVKKSTQILFEQDPERSNEGEFSVSTAPIREEHISEAYPIEFSNQPPTNTEVSEFRDNLSRQHVIFDYQQVNPVRVVQPVPFEGLSSREIVNSLNWLTPVFLFFVGAVLFLLVEGILNPIIFVFSFVFDVLIAFSAPELAAAGIAFFFLCGILGLLPVIPHMIGSYWILHRSLFGKFWGVLNIFGVVINIFFVLGWPLFGFGMYLVVGLFLLLFFVIVVLLCCVILCIALSSLSRTP